MNIEDDDNINEMRYGDTSVVYFAGYFPLTLKELMSPKYRNNAEPVSSLGPTWYGKYKKKKKEESSSSLYMVKKEEEACHHDDTEEGTSMYIEPQYVVNEDIRPFKQEEEEDQGSRQDSSLMFNDLDSEEENMLINIPPPSSLIDLTKASPTTSSETLTSTKSKKKVIKNDDDEEEEEETESKIDTLSKSSKEYSLFLYLQQLERGDSPILLSFGQVLNTFQEKCPILIEQNELDKPLIIKRMIKNFVEKIVLELISRDEKGKDILDILNRFHKLFISETKNGIGKNDYKRLDGLYHLIDKTCKQAFDVKTDPIYLAFSQKKTRGRRKQSNQLPFCNEVDVIRKDYIKHATSDMMETNTVEEEDGEEEEEEESNKGGGGRVGTTTQPKYYPPLDNYKVLLKTMKLVNDHLPRSTNHGYYLENVHRMIRNYENVKEDDTITPKWPLWRVFRAIFNMQCMPDIILHENFQTKGNEYRCCYSNDIIKDGDDIYVIQVYENDINRFEEWQIKNVRPDREFSTDELLNSNRVFVMKRKRLSPVSLFPVDYSKEYKEKYHTLFDAFNKVVVKTKATTTPKPVVTNAKPSSSTTKTPLITLNINSVSSFQRFNELFSLADNLMGRKEAILITSVQKVLSHIKRPKTILSKLDRLVRNIHIDILTNEQYDAKLLDIMNFIESFFNVNINEDDKFLDEDTFVSLLNRDLFEGGKDVITIQHQQQQQSKMTLKNTVFIRHFLYIIYERRYYNRSKVTQWSEVNPFLSNLNRKMEEKRVIDLPEYQQNMTLLIAFFDFLFKKSL